MAARSTDPPRRRPTGGDPKPAPQAAGRVTSRRGGAGQPKGSSAGQGKGAAASESRRQGRRGEGAGQPHGRPARGGPAAQRQSRGQAQSRGQGQRRGRGGAVAERRPIRAAVPVVAGIVWAVVVLVAVATSSFLTAVVVAPVALVATASTLRATEPRRRRRARSSRRPPLLLLVALAAAGLDPLVALAGPWAGLAVLAVSIGGLSALVVGPTWATSARPLRAVAGRLTAVAAPALAATSVVIARHQSSSLALALVAGLLAYDTGAFVMGHARTPLGGPVGVAFGILSIAVVAVFVAAVVNPPFSGSRPFIVFALVAAAAPAGVRLGQIAAGPQRLPALRRIDSWFVAAPVWVLVAALLLHK